MLTPKQKKLLAIASNGYLNKEQVNKVYASDHGQGALKHLIAAGYLEIDHGNFGHFQITEEGLNELVGGR